MQVVVQHRYSDRQVRCAAGGAGGVQVVHVRVQIWDHQSVCGGSQCPRGESQAQTCLFEL